MGRAGILTSTIGRRFFEAEALQTREVDALVSRLLGEIKFPYSSMGKKTLNQFADLKRILSANYLEAPGMPEAKLLRELARMVQSGILSKYGNFQNWDNPEEFAEMSQIMGTRELEVRAEPYTEGAGLSLRGFFCRTRLAEKQKFVIFLNSAHHPGAVAATFGHELGHYIYGSMVGETHEMTAFMEGTFGDHLLQTEELFSDSLVALAAYNRDLIHDIGSMDQIRPGDVNSLFGRIKRAYELIGPRFKLNLKGSQVSAALRLRYLTSMTHFLKLRSALVRGYCI